MMIMMMMNYFCGMGDRQRAFSLISNRDHCQRSSSSLISDTPLAGFEPAQNLSSRLIESLCSSDQKQCHQKLKHDCNKDKVEDLTLALIKNNYYIHSIFTC